MKNESVITIRTTKENRDKLEALARAKRLADGEPWTVADLVREAIEEKLNREGQK